MKMTKAKGTNPLILTWPWSKNPKGVIINGIRFHVVTASYSNKWQPSDQTNG